MSIHKPVLLTESIRELNLKKGDTVVDATLGGGGHSRKILEIIGKEGMLIAIDKDKESVISNLSALPFDLDRSAISNSSVANGLFARDSRFSIYKTKNNYFVIGNFADLDDILKFLKIKSVDAILADLGISSDQLENAERGFSFRKDAKLDMRMGWNSRKTAREIVNTYGQDDLEKILRQFGEEKYAAKIAEAIIIQRKVKPIERTLELVEIIKNATPKEYKRGRKHFAAKTFQALRIEVNNELENIKCFLPRAISALKAKGRLAVISFHSGEDKIVKKLFQENARGCVCPPEFPICLCGRKPKIKIITKKPIIPNSEEIKNNSRSRSAKLRVAEKL